MDQLIIQTSTMIYFVIISYILLFIGNWFYQQHEHVKFNYAGSYWEKLDNKMKRPWFKNNSRPDIKKAYPWAPPLWDGYHFFSWMMKWVYYMPFALILCLLMKWFIVLAITAAFSLVSFTFDGVSYKWTFK